jgi:hypothetical protein
MNEYKCFYRGRCIDVLADTSRDAQIKASKLFKAKKDYDVSVNLIKLAESDKPIVHLPLM